MKAGTLFSGIGAPEQAMPAWDWQWSADIDDFANAVRARHWPGVPNLGDVNEIDPRSVSGIDCLVFGSPCQSFSIAGKRLGMDDPRGNMALVALGLVSALRPRWFVFENVPGLFSSAGGEDFASLLRAVRECGYTGCWRVHDAQYHGVSQRRRRVFFVGCLGDDWRPSAAVLFEQESLYGDPPPRREPAKAYCAVGETGVGIGRGVVIGPSGGAFSNVAPTLDTKCKDGPVRNQIALAVMETEVAPIAFNSREDPEVTGSRTGPLSASTPQAQAVVLSCKERGPGSAQSVCSKPSHFIRRITPIEAERLQGFPDGYTNIPWRRKAEAPDSRRYKALGNSMAVPVMRWILERLGAVDQAWAWKS